MTQAVDKLDSWKLADHEEAKIFTKFLRLVTGNLTQSDLTQLLTSLSLKHKKWRIQG